MAYKSSPAPTTKYKWPTEKKTSVNTSDFVPYISNLINTFRKVPRPKTPALIDPVTGTRISMADARQQISNESRAADLSTQDLDAQTGAAIRVGNLATRLRASSDVNAREAQINAQLSNQTKSINAGINAQNTAIINQYHDDMTNADIAQQKAQSENIANATDKFIAQTAARDQTKLEKDKATIYSKMYNPGVYNRFLESLQKSGVDVSQFGTPPVYNEFEKYKNIPLPPANPQLDTKLPPQTLNSMKRYMKLRNVYAAGGMMKAFSGDPKPKANNNPVKMYGYSPRTSMAGNAAMEGTSNFAMNTDDNRMAHGIDLINSVVSSGMLPNQTQQDRTLRESLDPEMYQYLYQFNQRGDLKGMNPQQRIQAFYNIPANNQNIQAMKTNMRRYGYGPTSFWKGQNMADVTPIPTTVMKATGGSIVRKAKYSYGGRLKPFA